MEKHGSRLVGDIHCSACGVRRGETRFRRFRTEGPRSDFDVRVHTEGHLRNGRLHNPLRMEDVILSKSESELLEAEDGEDVENKAPSMFRRAS